jgi:hypothetical protein
MLGLVFSDSKRRAISSRFNVAVPRISIAPAMYRQVGGNACFVSGKLADSTCDTATGALTCMASTLRFSPW